VARPDGIAFGFAEYRDPMAIEAFERTFPAPQERAKRTGAISFVDEAPVRTDAHRGMTGEKWARRRLLPMARPLWPQA